MWSNVELTHSHGKTSRDSNQSQNMNLQIIIRKLWRQWLLRCSDLLGIWWNVITNVLSKCAASSMFNTVNAAVNPPLVALRVFLLCGPLCCLMLCNLTANAVTATGQHQTEQRQASAPQAAATDPSQNNAAKSDQGAAPKHDALKALKAFCAHKYTRVVVLSINVTCFLYCISEIISDWLARAKMPNL